MKQLWERLRNAGKWSLVILNVKKKCLEFYTYTSDDIRNANVWRFDSDSSLSTFIAEMWYRNAIWYLIIFEFSPKEIE